MSAYPSLLLDNCCIVRIAPHVADMGSQLSYIPSSLSSYLYLSCHLSLSLRPQFLENATIGQNKVFTWLCTSFTRSMCQQSTSSASQAGGKQGRTAHGLGLRGRLWRVCDGYVCWTGGQKSSRKWHTIVHGVRACRNVFFCCWFCA